MTIALTSPVTGGAQTGLTSPTYTLTTDTAPDVNGRQYAVTALGGTQTDVDTHSAAKPFTITYTKPKVYKAIGNANPVTGVINSVPMNTHQLLIRKGVLPASSQSPRNLVIRISVDVPAGSEAQDPEDIRAALSLAVGAVTQLSSGWGDTLISGIM